ncbi:MAG: hypothetical protein ACR2J5_08725 [Geodermatophilaceae bacterium]
MSEGAGGLLEREGGEDDGDPVAGGVLIGPATARDAAEEGVDCEGLGAAAAEGRGVRDENRRAGRDGGRGCRRGRPGSARTA